VNWGRDRHQRLALKKEDSVSNEDEERVAQLKDQLLNQNLTDAEIARIERKIEFLENRTT
jgi:hypothetical protein